MNYRLCVILLVYSIFCGVYASGSDSPQEHGANWVTLPADKEVEILLYDLQTADKDALRETYVLNLFNTRIQDAAVSPELKEAALQIKTQYLSRSTIKNFSTEAFISGNKIGLSKPDAEIDLGQRLINTPLSETYNIQNLSRSTTKSFIDRDLFSVVDKTASYYAITYHKEAPFVTSTYLQFVTDPVWNRIIYGNLNTWIRSYDKLANPSALAVDASGRVFIGEQGSQKITVLQITESGEQIDLVPLFDITDVNNPTDIALNDNGTPLDNSDDILYVADASRNMVLKYSLNSHSADLAVTYKNFDTPMVLASGKWNGSSTNYLYVIDKLSRRIQLFEDSGQSLTLLKTLEGAYDQYFTSLKSDHFGNIYVVDKIYAEIIKYTALLEFLDRSGEAASFKDLHYIDIPFATVVIEDEGTYWTGFDQLFALERWSESSGAQRKTLGLSLKNLDYYSDEEISVLNTGFLLTDFAEINFTVLNANGEVMHQTVNNLLSSGTKTMTWDRRDMNSALVPGGVYTCELEAKSLYTDKVLSSSSEVYLPTYYYQNCGNPDIHADEYLLQGKPRQWGTSASQTVVEDESVIRYRFSGLDPQRQYAVSAEYFAADQLPRHQNLTAGGLELHGPVAVTDEVFRTDYIELPKEAFTTGEVILSFNRQDQGSAVVSQVWLKETGDIFDWNQVKKNIPTVYELEQNYPNPFNPSTTIRFNLPESREVFLDVYDILGRKVITLLEARMEAGSHDIRFDAGTYASGIYIYFLRAGDFVASKKMLLVR